MTDEEIIKALSKEADNIEVPDRLKPDNIKIMLDNRNNIKPDRKGRIKRNLGRVILLAASLIAVVGAIYAINPFSKKSTSVKEGASSSSDRVESIGDSYILASSYDDIYKKIKDNANDIYNGGITGDLGMFEESNKGMAGAAEESVDSAGSNTSSDIQFSKTNTMVESIDEADVIKINEKLLFAVKGNKISIIDITKQDMTKVSEVSIDANSNLEEFYLLGDKLYVITTKTITSLADKLIGELLYNYYEKNYETSIITVDISNPVTPVVTACVSQDGLYYSSRLTNDYIYLFTKNRINGYTNESQAIPKVNDEKLLASDIYISNSDYVNSTLVISSVNIKKPDEVTDKLAIMDDEINIYMGESSIYLYGTDYTNNREYCTQITRFSYEEGVIKANGAGTTIGSVTDVFALSEKNGRLRILTTVTDRNTFKESGRLSVFDENMTMVSKIEAIAPGERIYAARYIGDIVYFVTYRNMDPLFAVDLSDDTNPQIIGFVEMTGYSDYLHPYGEGKLLGIGYETDPVTGARKGVKLTMFDISNPKEITILDSIVLSSTQYSPSLYDYKQVLADADKNVIGLLSYDYYNNLSYSIYTWKDGHIEGVMKYDMNSSDGRYTHRYYNESIRGLYSGDTLYLIEEETRVISFDMKNEYKKISEIGL